MVIWSYSQSRSIPTFKLHRVIITALGANVKFFSYFFLRDMAILGELAYILVGLGTYVLGAGESFWGVGMKDLFFVDGRNFEIIFSGV